ncbi:FAD-dependent oxidoreductase [Leptospira sp. GIMC2001]|uniref:FAD-dependent oxidoreductase n=1 Tax=Leptospira sp. GIMC2001 TaxID=1513297 RepID=UPI00234BC6F6|nr:FAD-dependent oxidoreductase [Leptospira sp. GIMC2001]WCL49328.1 FAD-dependent oxidoreductase [Leptospira sp. GIMC2001]
MKRIAIIGSGMAGLSIGYICKSNGFEVVLYEAQDSLNGGMDAHSFNLEDIDSSGWVDLPLRIMNPTSWKSVLALAKHLNVPTFEVRTGLTYFYPDENPWFKSGSISVLGYRIPYINWKYWNSDGWKIIKGIRWLRKYIRGSDKIFDSKMYNNHESMPDSEISIKELFINSKLDPIFWKGFLLPILVTICTCKEEIILDWPAHKLIQLTERLLLGENSLRFTNGTSSLVKALLQGVAHHANTKVTSITKEDSKIKIQDHTGREDRFDYCFVATQANQTNFLNPIQFKQEQEILSSFLYDEGDLILHTDSSFLPKNKKNWSALNYQVENNLETSMFTVWVNAVEPSISKGSIDLFQTWNPKFEPKSGCVVRRLKMQRAVVNRNTRSAIDQLNKLHLEKDRNLFFVGSWASPGIPLLESAVRSSMEVARILKFKIPWNV